MRGDHMTDPEAKAILNSYGAPVNIVEHMEAIQTAQRILGKDAGMKEIWRWAQDGEASNDKRAIPTP
jgi:hypothetical protein